MYMCSRPAHVHHATYWFYLFPFHFMLISYTPTDPLDVPVFDTQTCLSNCENATFIQLTWEEVECADFYVLDVPGLDFVNTTGTSYNMLYNIPATNFSGSIFTDGDEESVRPIEACSTTCDLDSTIPPCWFSNIYCTCACVLVLYMYA